MVIIHFSTIDKKSSMTFDIFTNMQYESPVRVKLHKIYAFHFQTFFQKSFSPFWLVNKAFTWHSPSKVTAFMALVVSCVFLWNRIKKQLSSASAKARVSYKYYTWKIKWENDPSSTICKTMTAAVYESIKDVVVQKPDVPQAS